MWVAKLRPFWVTLDDPSVTTGGKAIHPDRNSRGRHRVTWRRWGSRSASIFGTTNTVVAAVQGGVASTVPDPQGVKLIPSVVSFHPSGSVLVGRGALDRRLNDAANTIYSVKRLIGRPWGSPEVEQARGTLPFALSEGAQGATVVTARGESYGLPENQRVRPAAGEGGRGGGPRRARRERRHHRPGELQRPAARGDQDRGATGRAGGAPHPERAHGSRARLRPAGQGERADRGLRSRGRNVRRHAARPGGQRLRGALHGGRHGPRRRRHRRGGRRAHGGRSA